uniref:Epstein-Barr virus-like n=1 Tax=Oryza barthii TaxID=65489 RepID=A0A679B9T9_9ORYZ|nr:Epstein-Barr virus-like [Oryza barthii]
MDSSPACEENRAPVGFSGNRAAAEVAHAAAMLMAVAAWRGGGSSGCGARPEVAANGGASGERRGGGRRHGRARRKGEKREGDAGKLYRGSRGVDMAGKPPDFAGDVGERERVGGEFKSNPAHLRARARAGMAGRAAMWGRGVGARRGAEKVAARTVSGRLPSWGWRLEEGDNLTGGPHLSASRREGKGERASPKEGGRAREVVGRRPNREKEGKEKEKEERIFPGI